MSSSMSSSMSQMSSAMSSVMTSKLNSRVNNIMFRKSLHDLIRGLRNCKDPDAAKKYVRDAITECRQECQSQDMDVKTMAVLKLAYVSLLALAPLRLQNASFVWTYHSYLLTIDIATDVWS